MATYEERARSFGAIAADYDRLRPQPAPEAFDWLIPEGAQVAVDVAAGTGLFTRGVAARVKKVIAVEPDPGMREILAARSPEIEVLEGTGEQIPLPDASADALFVASAWHWLDPERALPEMARVLRDNARLGVLWTSRDRDVDWVRDLDRPPGDLAWDGERGVSHRERRNPRVLEGPDFGPVEQATFGYLRPMAVEDLIQMVATYSAVITATDDARSAVLDSARAKLSARFPGATELEVPIRSWCFRATRKPRKPR